MTIFELREMIELKSNLLKEMREKHKELEQVFVDDIVDHKETLKMAIQGMKVEEAVIARKIIFVDGEIDSSVRNEVIHDAINELLLNRGKKFKREYMGVKNYQGFGDQRCDCEYGMGPTHGSIVFEVGFTKEARGKELSDEELEAAVHYLGSL